MKQIYVDRNKTNLSQFDECIFSPMSELANLMSDVHIARQLFRRELYPHTHTMLEIRHEK